MVAIIAERIPTHSVRMTFFISFWWWNIAHGRNVVNQEKKRKRKKKSQVCVEHSHLRSVRVHLLKISWRKRVLWDFLHFVGSQKGDLAVSLFHFFFFGLIFNGVWSWYWVYWEGQRYVVINRQQRWNTGETCHHCMYFDSKAHCRIIFNLSLGLSFSAIAYPIWLIFHDENNIFLFFLFIFDDGIVLIGGYRWWARTKWNSSKHCISSWANRKLRWCEWTKNNK